MERIVIALALPAGIFGLWLLTQLAGGGLDAVSARGGNWLTTVFFGGVLVLCLLALWRSVESRDDDEADALTPVLGVMSLALLLIFGTELFYVEDFFSNRLNSVFKLQYQAWLLLGVTGGFSAWWVLSRWQPEVPSMKTVRQGALGVMAVCVFGALLYPVGATLSRTEGLARAGRTLDGMDYVRATNADEYLAIDWLRNRAQPGERLIEANGDSYSVGSQISARSGIPTVLGWPGHEQQWGRDGVALQERKQAVDRAYTTASLDEAVEILRKYGVTYVFVGSGYRGAYPVAALDKFETGLQSVFKSGDVSIYRLPPLEPSAVR